MSYTHGLRTDRQVPHHHDWSPAWYRFLMKKKRYLGQECHRLSQPTTGVRKYNMRAGGIDWRVKLRPDHRHSNSFIRTRTPTVLIDLSHLSPKHNYKYMGRASLKDEDTGRRWDEVWCGSLRVLCCWDPQHRTGDAGLNETPLFIGHIRGAIGKVSGTAQSVASLSFSLVWLPRNRVSATLTPARPYSTIYTESTRFADQQHRRCWITKP